MCMESCSVTKKDTIELHSQAVHRHRSCRPLQGDLFSSQKIPAFEASGVSKRRDSKQASTQFHKANDSDRMQNVKRRKLD